MSKVKSKRATAMQQAMFEEMYIPQVKTEVHSTKKEVAKPHLSSSLGLNSIDNFKTYIKCLSSGKI